MPKHYTHPETEGLRLRLQHDPDLASAAKTRAVSTLCLVSDLLHLQLGLEPHSGTPEQQSLRERCCALFLSLGLVGVLGDAGEPAPPETPAATPPHDENGD